MKRSPIKRRTELKRSRFISRNPERAPLRARSKKTEKLYARKGGRRDFVAALLAKFPQCQASVENVCEYRSVDVHELLARSQGGSILDPENCIAVCRACHSWIGNFPKDATGRGLRRRRYNSE